MIRAHRVDVDGARLVLMTEGHYESLCRAAGRAADDDGLRARREAGLSQQALADLAGLRQETLSRIETAKHSATPATIAKIERAIAKANKTTKGR
jgi:DNA-binding XRE family transcriptional regulator